MIIIVTAVIAEFNPLHSGHLALLSEARARSQACIVILSGNFTQRGSPAFADKFTRARMALLAGADLVLELPFLMACSAAHDFAKGAVALAAELGLADTLAFGMETPDADILSLIQAENSEAFSTALRKELSLGAAYPKAYALALEAVYPGAGRFIARPNNLLGLSYVREIVNSRYPLKPLMVKRTGTISSRLIRENFLEHARMMPDFSRSLIEDAQAQGRLADEEKLWPLLQSAFIRYKAHELRDFLGVDEGIEGRFLKFWTEAESLEEFMGKCVCARYTRSHIRRRLVYILLGLSRTHSLAEREYIRVLGFNSRGQELLRRGSAKFITRFKDVKDTPQGELELKASRLWELCVESKDFEREFCPPVIMQ